MNLPGTVSPWIGSFQKHEFDMHGRRVKVVCPHHPLAGPSGLPWAWKGEFLDAFPAVELALLRAGLHIVHLNYPDQFGSPSAVREWNALYALLTGEYGFAKKPALIGLSRGGLYCYNWAAANPDKVACIFGDAPVCDTRSWPGGKGRAVGNAEEWQKAMHAFGFSSEAEAMAYNGNPVDTLAPLAAAGIPILHVYGDADEVVPWEKNTGVVAERYRKLGGEITLIAKPGCGHHPHGLDDPTPIVEFILKHTGKSTV